MKVSSPAGMNPLAATPAITSQDVNSGQQFETQLRQATNELDKQKSAKAAVAPPDAAAAERIAQEDKKLRKVCQDMEAVFLNMLMSQMRASIPADPLLGDSNAKKIIQSMLDTEMTKDMAKSGGMGLGNMLYRQLSPTLHASKGRNA